MSIMRAAFLSNTTFAATIRQQEDAAKAAQQAHQDRQQAEWQARETARQTRLVKYQRDVAIAALVKARKNHKKVRPLQAQVLATVASLRSLVR